MTQAVATQEAVTAVWATERQKVETMSRAASFPEADFDCVTLNWKAGRVASFLLATELYETLLHKSGLVSIPLFPKCYAYGVKLVYPHRWYPNVYRTVRQTKTSIAVGFQDWFDSTERL